MRRLQAPLIVIAVAGFVFGMVYRYLWDNPSEASAANYLRSGMHGMMIATFGWGSHLYFTLRGGQWLRKQPLFIEIARRAIAMAITIAAKRKPDPTAEDEPAFEAHLAGTLEFALDRQKIVGLQLKGEGIVDEERKDDKGNVMTIKGHGPLEVVKKVRFPKADEKK